MRFDLHGFGNSKRSLVALIVAISGVSSAQAINLTGDLFSDIRFTDNVAKSSSDTRSDTVQSVGVNLALAEERKHFQTNFNLRLEKEFYYEDSFEGRTNLTTGVGLVNFGIVESFLDWKSSLSRTELLNDPLADDLPDNRTFRTIYRTGPTFNYKVSKVTNMNLDLEYEGIENSNPEVSDSERATGKFGLTHLYNQLTSFTAALNATDAFDNDQNPGFKRGNFNVGMNRQFNRGDFSLKYGQTRIKPDEGNNASSTFYEFSANRRDFWFHDFTFQASRNISDTSAGFEDQEFGGDVQDLIDGVAVTDFITREKLVVSMSRKSQSYAYQIDANWTDEDYDVQNSDERSRGIGVRVDHTIADNLNVGYSYKFQLNHFVEDPTVGKEKVHTLRADSGYKLGEDISLNGYIQHSNRINNTSPIREFEEWTVGVGFKWAFLK